jgi:cobalt/nickel transport system permease protein
MSGVHALPIHAEIDSPIHRAPASTKLAATLAFVAALALMPAERWGWMAAAVVAVFVAQRVARLPLAASLARLAVAQPFVLGVAVLSLFQGRGLVVFASVALKATACVAAVQLLAATTKVGELLAVLRRAHVPEALVSTLALLHRYLFVLVEESSRMRRARRARTWRATRWEAWKALASVVAVSFVRSVTRAERVSAAMRARGWS